MTGRLAGSAPPAGDYDADILILSLDRVAETEAAIRSALGQEGLSRHVIVFDQGSSEATLLRLRALIEPRVDALVVAESGTAARAVALLDEQPGLAALGFRIMNTDGTDEDHASWGYPEALRPRAADRFACVTFVGAGHAIRRATWDTVGGYDPSLFFTWEEFDFALRAIDQGWTLLHAGDIAVHHKLATQARVDWSARRWFLFVRNRLYIERKWRPPPVALLARAAGYGLRSVRLGLGRQCGKAVLAALRMPLPAPPRRMSAAGRAYLRMADTAWRGGFWARWRGEVMAGLPSSRQRQARNSAVTDRP
jgi:GT2 family glycosyltransferase